VRDLIVIRSTANGDNYYATFSGELGRARQSRRTTADISLGTTRRLTSDGTRLCASCAADIVESRFDQVRCPSPVKCRHQFERRLRGTCNNPLAIDELRIDERTANEPIDDDAATVEFTPVE
jgi:hypothetical protein